MYVLVIIDMQAFYGVDNRSPVSLACYREINNAVRDNAFVICLEGASGGYTLPMLTHQLNWYSRSRIIGKEFTGAKQVSNLIDQHNLPKKVRVGGIYADACVWGFVNDLAPMRPDCSIEVVDDAVSNLHIKHDELDGRLYRLSSRMSNVVLV